MLGKDGWTVEHTLNANVFGIVHKIGSKHHQYESNYYTKGEDIEKKTFGVTDYKKLGIPKVFQMDA